MFVLVLSRKFIDLCSRALKTNAEMILSNQQNYHEAMKQSFNLLVEELSLIMNEQVSATAPAPRTPAPMQFV